ncbi:restriction endonuclease subunit S [Deinococcus sp. PESE-13]
MVFDVWDNVEPKLSPTEEQKTIANYISSTLTDTERISARAQAEISLLREYRTRLIADVVTGKLDVREAAAQLPEPEQEALPEDVDAGEDEGLEDEEEGTGEEE